MKCIYIVYTLLKPIYSKDSPQISDFKKIWSVIIEMHLMVQIMNESPLHYVSSHDIPYINIALSLVNLI